MPADSVPFSTARSPRTVGHDARALTIDGRRRLLLSGAVHYPRSTPSMWPGLMARSKAAGLDTIETYVFWNLHEAQRGVFDFSGRLDLRRFVTTAADHGLHVILRIGPYICAETDYGGFPAWLRDEPGVALRTENGPYMRAKEAWVRHLVGYVADLFAPRGGPIIATQIENEYDLVAERVHGEAGLRYLAWSVELGRSLGVGVPWLTCHSGQGGHDTDAQAGSITTLNAMYAHRDLPTHREHYPGQPGLWTEMWPSWYETFGTPLRRRAAEDVAYATARFVAGGGTGVNYYMWHGGTNLGRTAMFLQPPLYFADSPLDEYGRETTKSRHLGRLHRLLQDHADTLVSIDPPEPEPRPGGALSFAYEHGERRLVFVSNDTDGPVDTEVEGHGFTLPPRSLRVLVDGEPAFDSATVADGDRLHYQQKPSPKALSAPSVWREPMPDARPTLDAFHATRTADAPTEQLALTANRTDYCWYETALKVGGGKAKKRTLTFHGAGDVLHVLVNGKRVASTPRLVEDCGPVDGDGFVHRFDVKLKPGRHTLAVLACAMGLVKGEWMIGYRNLAEERKGLWGTVTLDGKPVKGPWRMSPGLAGEALNLPGAGYAAVSWRDAPENLRPLTWVQTAFDRPKADGPWTLDLRSMTKGFVWLNGYSLGRYWQLDTQMPEEKNWPGDCLTHDPAGLPTQRYLHLPPDYLADRNRLVLFDELGGRPAGLRLVRA
ncbi:MAG: beta-galactosidase [Planctomycetota bacterium]